MPSRVKCLNIEDNNSGVWAFVSELALEPYLSVLYFSVLCAIFTSTVAYPPSDCIVNMVTLEDGLHFLDTPYIFVPS